MTQVFIGLGANTGDREGALREAERRLATEVGPVVLRSSIYRTDPVEVVDQAEFLNQVVAVETTLHPAALLERLLAIERGMGRVRTRNKGPRSIDLDLLIHGDAVVRGPGLEVPHPRLHLRRFVLVPLAEIAPDLRHPVFGTSIRDLLSRCSDDTAVRPA